MDINEIATASGRLAVHHTPGPEPAVVCLHGFTLTGGMFDRLASELGTAVLAPDLPGHGTTTISPVDLPTTLEAIATWLADLGGPHPLLGYSQGGRIALRLAARHAHLVSQLIVVSAGLGLSDAALARRRTADHALASRIETIGVETFLEDWLTHPLVGTAHLPPQVAAADRRLRVQNTAPGLASALRGLGQGAMAPVDTTEIAAPITWIAGQRDEQYAAMAEAYATEGRGTAVIVPDVGHNVVLEAPAELAAIVARIIRRP